MYISTKEQVVEHAVVLGATGRVGAAVVTFALEAGHRVTAVARNPAKVGVSHDRLSVVQGDTLDPAGIRSVLAAIPDATAVVMAVGADPLRPSTVVTDTVRNLASAMVTNGPPRYLGITGTAQMPATLLGRITQAAIRRAIKAAADHQGAYDIITATDLDYTLAACPYIKDGPHTGRYHREPGRFPGGFKIITPADVADFLVDELGAHHYHRQTIGIWS
jgi:putative NADH-flavin reductase